MREVVCGYFAQFCNICWLKKSVLGLTSSLLLCSATPGYRLARIEQQPF